MENELLFEHLINQKVSNCIRWADLYRGASVVNEKGEHDPFKVGEVHVCLFIALSRLSNELSGEKQIIVKKHFDLLHTQIDFDTIDMIITDLHDNYIIF